jgi:hypothetical protein
MIKPLKNMRQHRPTSISPFFQRRYVISMSITEILAPDGSKIYIQYEDEEGDDLYAVGILDDIGERTKKFQQTLESTVNGYAAMMLGTIKQGLKDSLTPNKVTLEFGLQLGGEAGVPFVTKGTAEANVKVTIEWELGSTSRNSYVWAPVYI